MAIEGTLPPEFVKLLVRVLAHQGISDARVVGCSSGKQGTCFIIEGQPGHERFVLKTMSSVRPSNSPDSVEREYRALELFHEATRAHPDVGAPEPLGLFKEQLGYLMSYVDAPSIDDLLKANLLTDEDIQTIAGRIVRALELYYRSVGEIYGDFQSVNVLVRPSLQVVLIDPTPTNPFQQLIGNGTRYSPMSADLGYWAYSVASRSVKQVLRGSRLPARLYRLTSEIIAYASRACPNGDADEFSNAIYEVAERYMTRLKTQRRLRIKVLGPLAESRLRALKTQSQKTVTKRQSGRGRPQPTL
jgi:RIO1 family protein